MYTEKINTVIIAGFCPSAGVKLSDFLAHRYTNDFSRIYFNGHGVPKHENLYGV